MSYSTLLKTRLRHYLALGFCGLASAAMLPAETLTGQVRDANNNSFLIGARITVEGTDRQTVTDREGRYHFRDLDPGSYTVTVNYLGYNEVSATVQVASGQDMAQNFTVGAEVLSMDAFVVEGMREGQARALQQKMAAVNVIDVISADSVGKLPDGNAAEALRRVPGISVQIDQDEGRYVVVRGIDSALNNVTLNGLSVGTPSEKGNRGIALDSVPADLISNIEVVKAVTPDMDANAIGGSVNIVTQSAFDRPEGFVYATVAGFYDSFSEKTTPNASLSFGKVIDEAGKWGVAAGLSYSLKDFKSQTINQRAWKQFNGEWVPARQQPYDYAIERERIGANVALQFRPNEDHELALRINHNEFSDSEDRQSNRYEFARGTLSNQTPTSGDFSGGRANRQFRDYEQTGTIDALSLEGDHLLANDLHVSWQAGLSKGERDVGKRNDWEFRSGGSAFPNSYVIGPDLVSITPDSNDYYDPSAYPLRRVRFRTDLEREDVGSAQIDLERDFTFAGRYSRWKIGGKFITRDKDDDRHNQNYSPDNGGFTLGEPGLTGPEIDNYFKGFLRYGPTLDVAALEAFYAANPSLFKLNVLDSLEDSLADDFEASEDVLSGYAMVEMPVAERVTMLAGLRIEHTDASYAANELFYNDGDFEGDYRRVTGSSDYTNVLPGLHFVWRPEDNIAVRFAWTNTLGRPDYADLAPRRELEALEDTPGVYIGSLSTGNPELDPYESMNFDLSLEYYLENAGILSLGAFHKQIDNPIYTRNELQTDVTVDGRFYSELSVTAPANADKGEITGVELNYSQPFTFLPAPFDGFGASINFTFVDSSATLFTRSEELPFFGQADTLANVALYYEKHGWEARIAYSRTDDYLLGVGKDTDTDLYLRQRDVIDAKLSYRINEHYRVFLELLNLDSEPLREFTGVPARENDYDIYDWKAKFGISYTY
jgi:TonB-dependent receptor